MNTLWHEKYWTFAKDNGDDPPGQDPPPEDPPGNDPPPDPD